MDKSINFNSHEVKDNWMEYQILRVCNKANFTKTIYF
jgi:hypothetical protein